MAMLNNQIVRFNKLQVGKIAKACGSDPLVIRDLSLSSLSHSLHSDWHETGCIYAKQSNEHYNALHISKMCSTFGSVPTAKASTRLKGSHVSFIPFSFRSFSFKVLSLLLLPCTSCMPVHHLVGAFKHFFLVQKNGMSSFPLTNDEVIVPPRWEYYPIYGKDNPI